MSDKNNKDIPEVVEIKEKKKLFAETSVSSNATNYAFSPVKYTAENVITLLEYLIKTYTNENEIVLDFTMGSGSTGVACMNLNRKFIGIELGNNYFDIAINRIFENYNI